MKHSHIGPRRSVLRYVLALAVSPLVSGCGGGTSPTSPDVQPPPTVASPRLLLQGSQRLPVMVAMGAYFQSDAGGTLDATVDYTFATSQILVWIVRGQCTEAQFAANQCDVAASSFTGPKPRKVSVTGAASGSYLLVVGNAGPQEEAVSFQIVLTPGPSGASLDGLERSPSSLPAWFQMPLPRR